MTTNDSMKAECRLCSQQILRNYPSFAKHLIQEHSVHLPKYFKEFHMDGEDKGSNVKAADSNQTPLGSRKQDDRAGRANSSREFKTVYRGPREDPHRREVTQEALPSKAM